MIVVDLGCAPHGDDVSIASLVERFAPDVLYGFDPWPGLMEGKVQTGQTEIILSRSAAWIFDGFVGYIEDGLRSRVYEFTAGAVPCFDIARFIRHLPEDEIVLKMDIEGGEYPVCQRLHETGVDDRISLALVEWHDEGQVALRCPVKEWDHLAVAA